MKQLILLFITSLTIAQEFTPTYNWQVVHTDRESLPKGLEIQLNLFEKSSSISNNNDDNDDNDDNKKIYARIPQEWKFQTFVNKRTAKPTVRPGFARIKIQSTTKLWDVALEISNRAKSEPEQLTFLLNHSLCLATNALGYNPTVASTLLDQLDGLYADRSKWFTTDVVQSMLFQVKHCISIVFQDQIISHPDQVWHHIKTELDCVEKRRCEYRYQRLNTCNSYYSKPDVDLLLERCLWPLVLLEACSRKCNLDDEILTYRNTTTSVNNNDPNDHNDHGGEAMLLSLLHTINISKEEKLTENRYEMGKYKTWAFDHGEWNYSAPTTDMRVSFNTNAIPYRNKVFRCSHCCMIDKKIQLMAPSNWQDIQEQDLDNSISYSRHVPYYTLHQNVFLHFHNDTMHRFKQLHSLKNARNVEDSEDSENVGDEYMGGDGGQGGDGGDGGEGDGSDTNVLLLDDGKKNMDSNQWMPYTCDRRYVHPVIHASVWSIHNMFHIVWDLIVPLLHTVMDQMRFTLPIPIHLFLEVGHPWMRSRLHRLLRGDYAIEGVSPVGYLLARVTGGVPVHSTAWLEQQKGVTCFDYFHSGLSITSRDPMGHGFEMGKEGYGIWSTLSKNRKDMYDSGKIEDETEHLDHATKLNYHGLVGNILKQKYNDRLNGKYSKRRCEQM